VDRRPLPKTHRAWCSTSPKSTGSAATGGEAFDLRHTEPGARPHAVKVDRRADLDEWLARFEQLGVDSLTALPQSSSISAARASTSAGVKPHGKSGSAWENRCGAEQHERTDTFPWSVSAMLLDRVVGVGFVQVPGRKCPAQPLGTTDCDFAGAKHIAPRSGAPVPVDERP
jgi:hypothetical protein